MIRRKYANMRIYEDNIDFADVENTITYSLSAKNLENNLNKREEELCNKIADLETKLAEKEKEIDNLYDRLNNKQKFYEMSLEKDYKEYLSRLDKLEKQCDKDKISFAITELEKVRKFVVGDCGLETAEGNARIEISKYIKQQINELKGKVEDVKD